MNAKEICIGEAEVDATEIVNAVTFVNVIVRRGWRLRLAGFLFRVIRRLLKCDVSIECVEVRRLDRVRRHFDGE